MTFKTIALSVCAVAVFGFGYAAHLGPKDAFTCPVTKLKMPAKKDAAAKSVYKGKTYYFCTTHCKQLFDKNPAKYIKSH